MTEIDACFDTESPTASAAALIEQIQGGAEPEAELAGSECVDAWLAILRAYELRDDATERTEHSTPPKGSLRQLPLMELGRELLEQSACDGPGELVEGQDYDEVAEGVYLLSTHSQSKSTGHVFLFQLRVTAAEKRGVKIVNSAYCKREMMYQKRRTANLK